MTIRTVNGLGLEEAILNEDLPVVAAFLSKFSIPCAHFLPQLHVVAEQLKGAVFVQVDFDQGRRASPGL